MTSRLLSGDLRFFMSFTRFAIGWIPSGYKTRPKDLTSFRKKERFVRSCFETSLPKKGMVLVDDHEHLIFVL